MKQKGILKINQIDKIFSPLNVTYYSLARYALLEALKQKGLGESSSILIPNFICKDILQPINELCLEIKWFSIGPNCLPLDSSDHWPIADCVLMVNYFGFPQSLEPYQKYSDRTGAIIIEDCAHGFFSRDEMGRNLGMRGDVSIASLRKIFPLCDGAILISREKVCQQKKYSKIGFNPRINLRGKIKNKNKFLFQLIITFKRIISRRRLNKVCNVDKIPHIKSHYSKLFEDLEAVNIPENLQFRREAFEDFLNFSRYLSITPTFNEIPMEVFPYGFPFRSSNLFSIFLIWLYACYKGFDFFMWPDLPEMVKLNNRDLKPLYFINFL